MRLLPTLYLIISGCIAILLTSCATQTVKGYEQQKPVAANYAATYFSDASTDYVYKANISIYGREFGGIFIAKKINDTLHRVAFTTEFGNKLFDFEITDSSFKVNYILEELDRKVILNTLRKDFMLLLKKKHTIQQQYESPDFLVYTSGDGNRTNYLFIDKENKRLSKLVNATKAKEKVIISYIAESDILAKKIIIDHKNIKLKIELNYLQ